MFFENILSLLYGNEWNIHIIKISDTIIDLHIKMLSDTKIDYVLSMFRLFYLNYFLLFTVYLDVLCLCLCHLVLCLAFPFGICRYQIVQYISSSWLSRAVLPCKKDKFNVFPAYGFLSFRNFFFYIVVELSTTRATSSTLDH